MKPVVGLYIKCPTYGQKRHQIEVKLCGPYGQWEEPGSVRIYGNIMLTHWTKYAPAYFFLFFFKVLFILLQYLMPLKFIV